MKKATVSFALAFVAAFIVLSLAVAPAMARPYYATITVKDYYGNPMINAKVELMSWDAPINFYSEEVYTDSRGVAKIPIPSDWSSGIEVHVAIDPNTGYYAGMFYTTNDVYQLSRQCSINKATSTFPYTEPT